MNASEKTVANGSPDKPVILIVDDTPANLRYLVDLLNKHDFHVRVATNGAMATSIAQSNEIDLILLDIVMPDMDGFAVCRNLKQNPTTRDIPIIFISAKDDSQNVIQGFAVGGMDYIAKPFQPEEVLARIRTHIHLRNMQKRLEKKHIELKERESLLSLFITHTPAPVAMCNRQMCYIAWSRRWIEDYQLPYTDLTGRCHYDVFPEIPEHWKAQHRRCLNGEVLEPTEDRFIRADGKVEWVKREIVPWWDASGQIGGLIMFTEVITERKRTELELMESRKIAEAANQVKSNFLSNISHEIRTPMNAILGYTELLLMNTTDDSQRSYLKAINASGTELLVMIDDIIELTKMDTGNGDVTLKPVNVGRLLEQLYRIFHYEFTKKQIRFQSVPDPGLPDFVLLDESGLRQVLCALIGNALKFTHEGSVTVRGSYNPDGSLLFEVEDTGIGISEANQQNIFNDFWQMDDSSSRKYGGIGIGLALARRLTEKMKGRLTVKSTPGKGSLFQIMFPDVQVVEADSDSVLVLDGLDIDDGLMGDTQTLDREDHPETMPQQPVTSCISEMGPLIRTQLIPMWESIRKTMIFSDIVNFLDEMNAIAEKYHCHLLINWGKMIQHEMRCFNLEKLADEFQRFPNLIEQLEVLTAGTKPPKPPVPDSSPDSV